MGKTGLKVNTIETYVGVVLLQWLGLCLLSYVFYCHAHKSAFDAGYKGQLRHAILGAFRSMVGRVWGLKDMRRMKHWERRGIAVKLGCEKAQLRDFRQWEPYVLTASRQANTASTGQSHVPPIISREEMYIGLKLWKYGNRWTRKRSNIGRDGGISIRQNVAFSKSCRSSFSEERRGTGATLWVFDITSARCKNRVRKPEIPEVQVKNGKYEYHYQSLSSLQAPTRPAASRKPGKHLEAPDTVVNQPVLVECAG